MVIVGIPYPGPYPPQAAHTIVGKGDEHLILTTPGLQQQQQQQRQQQNLAKYSQRPPKFSAIVNEYMGACLEDHCNIGKGSISSFNIQHSSYI